MANDSLIQLIKRIAVDAVEASKPCNAIIAKVTAESPLKILVGQKLILDDDFLIVCAGAKEKLKKGASVLLIRQEGGEQYIVVDTIGGDDDVT